MDNAHGVAVTNSVNNGSDGVSCLFLRVVLLLHDSVEQLTACHEFHNQVQAVTLVENLEKLDDVGVVELREDVDL